MRDWFWAIKQAINLARKVWAQEKEVARQLTPRQRQERLYIMARKQADFWMTQGGWAATGQLKRSVSIAKHSREWLEERGYPVPVYPPIIH